MSTENTNLFENAVSIETLESRLELAAAASKVHATVDYES